jgi:hypothetical protein
MPLTPLNRLNAIFVLAVDRIAKSPYLLYWSMSSAIGLYTSAGVNFFPLPLTLELTDAGSSVCLGTSSWHSQLRVGTWFFSFEFEVLLRSIQRSQCRSHRSGTSVPDR